MPGPPSLGFGLEIRTGAVPGKSGQAIAGHSDSLGTNFATIAGAASTSPLVDSFVAGALGIASTDANDTADGTGARTARVVGLDTAGAVLTEDVILDGQTKVALLLDFSAVNGAFILTAGSGGKNAGNLFIALAGDTFTAGVPTAPIWELEAAFNLARVGRFTVPAGQKYVPTSFYFGGNSTKPITVQVSVLQASGLWFVIFDGDADPAIDIPVESGVTMSAGQTIRIRAKVASGTGAGTCLIQGFLAPA